MTALNPFQRHILIGTAIRMCREEGRDATPRLLGEKTGLDLSTIHNDLADMLREKTVVREDHGAFVPHQAKSSRFVYKLAEAVNS